MKDNNSRKLGSNGLIDIIRKCSHEINPGSLTAGIVHELHQFSSAKEYDDDLTILCLEMTDSYYCNWTTSNIDIGQATRLLITPLKDKRCNDSRFIKKVQVAIYEALMNAIDHGNLEISSKSMNINCDEVMYEFIKKERLTNPEYGNRKVITRYQVSDDRITYHIKDEGSGFNYMNIEDPTTPHNLEKCNGRGLAMIKMYMDEVSFNDKGNEIIMAINLPADIT
jgi:anti-sigma regulatory factor (Ser/Thr protein kinase)